MYPRMRFTSWCLLAIIMVRIRDVAGPGNAMRYDPKEHHRRSIRLRDYDYAQAGAYFVTVCAEGHTCLFGDIIDAEMRLNDAGRMVQAVWNELPDHYPGVETDAFVVMPNHIHAIIVLSVGAGPRACPNSGPCADPNEMGQPLGGRGQQQAERGQPREGMGQPRGVGGQPRGIAPTGSAGRAMSLADVVHRFKTWTTKRYTDGVRRRY